MKKLNQLLENSTIIKNYFGLGMNKIYEISLVLGTQEDVDKLKKSLEELDAFLFKITNYHSGCFSLEIYSLNKELMEELSEIFKKHKIILPTN